MSPQEILKEYNRGTKFLGENKYEKASIIFRKLIKHADFKEAWLNLGNCHRLECEYDKAKKAYLKSNEPHIPHINGKYADNYPLAHSNLGLLYYANGDDEIALKHYNKAIEMDPEYNDALWNKASVVLRQLMTGIPSGPELAEGWKLYTYRFKRNKPVVLKNKLNTLIVWPVEEKPFVDTIVVLAEQGQGDFLMFGRYLRELKKYCNNLYVQCEPIMDCFFSDYNVCRDPSEINAPIVYGFPMCQLGQILDYIPDEKWLPNEFYNSFPRSASFDRDIRIGVVYSGSTTHANNHNRSVYVDRFRSLASFGTLYSLTPGFTGNKFLKACPCSTWRETVDYIQTMDLVISVDTSIVHLAGSLGVECWMLQPCRETDFRWGNKRDAVGIQPNTSSNVWYSSVTVFNNPNNWYLVFKRVERELVKFKAAKREEWCQEIADAVYAKGEYVD